MGQQGLPRVLVAGTQEAIDRARRALRDDAIPVPALSVEAAVQRLDPGIALILCHVRFDDSRMFDFLGALDEGAYQRVPVVCFRLEPARLPPALERSVELALAEIGIAAFVDLPALERDLGASEALQALRERLLEALATRASPPRPSRLSRTSLRRP